MREKIVLAPGLNGNELTRTLALHGVNSIGMRICGAAELARMALMRSGIPVEETFVSAREEAAVAAEAVSGEAYFGKASFSDIREIASAIRRMRSLVPEGNEEEVLAEKLSAGIFAEKNRALLNVCLRYLALLRAGNALDGISLVRKAAAECGVIDADFLTLEEYPLSPLEQKLLERVSGGRSSGTSLPELFGAGSGALRIEAIRDCYGAPNEVETVLGDIYGGGRLDECTVAVTDAMTYGQLFFDYAVLYDIPVTFGCGIPVINSNPAKLLSSYDRWRTGGFFGAAAIGALFSDDAFDRSKLYGLFPERDEHFRWDTFYELLGDLRLTDDARANGERIKDFRNALEAEAAADTAKEEVLLRKKSCIPCLEIVGRELGLPAEEFIARYAYIRRGSDTNAQGLLTALDTAAAGAICEELRVIRSAGADRSAEDVIPNVLKMMVCAQGSEPGKLHVTGIGDAFASLRKHLYIAGLSASRYPGSPRENYLLLDADLGAFGPGAEAYKAKERIRRKRQQVLSLAKLASALGTKVSLSYAGLNVSELKRDNASSLVFELFREANGEDASAKELEEFTRKVEYFEPAISPSRLVGAAYAGGNTVCPGGGTAGGGQTPLPQPMDRAWSPTALEIYFDCPRRFMLRYLLGIPEPEEDDPFAVMSALDTGNLAHALMEELGGRDMAREEFLSLAGQYFDRFIREHPPLIAENVPPERDRFLEMMDTAYEMDPHREIALEEEDVTCTHESGVRIHGFPDRVEKLKDGTCLVVDFKSKQTVSHVQDDIRTCLQVVLYAYMMEQKGYRVSGAEYRYIRFGQRVTCRYDGDMKRQLSERLEAFRAAMESGSFPLPKKEEGGDDPCRYCKLGAVCGKSAGEGMVSGIDGE